MERVTTWDDLLHPGRASRFFDGEPRPEFDPAATGYRWENAWWLAELCRLIYRHDIEEDAEPLVPRRADFLAQVGLRQVGFFNGRETGTQGFLVQSTTAPLYSALVFRGTEQDVRDFLHDIDIIRVPFAGGTGAVARGFFKAFSSVWPEVSSALDSIEGPVFYTGHSLGAALATLAAARRPPRALYTFGSPLVGDSAFAASLMGVNVHRVVDDTDAVTVVPPEALGFRHAGALQQLRAPPIAAGSPHAGLLDRPPKRLDDHTPLNYVARLGR